MLRIPVAFALSLAQLRDPAMIRILGKTIAITIAVFGALAAVAYTVLDTLFVQAGMFAGQELTILLTVMLTLIGGWLLFRIVALLVIQFFADDIVAAVMRRHYPGVDNAKHDRNLRLELANGSTALLRTVGVNALAALVAVPLIGTGIGPVLVFGIANAWLMGRELQDIVKPAKGPDGSQTAGIGATERFILGAIVTLLLAIPFVNLLAPLLGTASAVHLVHRGRKTNET